MNVSRGRKEIDERVKISVEESRCELHTQPRFASAHFFLYRLAKQRRKIERDNRFSATRLFLNLRAANVRVPTTFAYPGSCLSLVQLPLRSSRLVVRIRGQESVRRHVAMEINAPSSISSLNQRVLVGCVSSPESLRYADGTLTRLPRHAYTTPLQQRRTNDFIIGNSY